MNKLGKCQFEGCDRPAVCALYKRSPNGQKVWLYVCEHHEQMIGDENMRWAEQRRDTHTTSYLDLTKGAVTRGIDPEGGEK